MQFNVILFDDFETLDALGPAEVIGKLANEYQLEYYSLNGGIVTSNHRVRVDTFSFDDMDTAGILLIPGGIGVQKLLSDEKYIERIKAMSEKAVYVLTVCTGSALLAKTGLINGLSATTTKRVFAWASSFGKDVKWVKKARWVKDGKYYTSSGISAGIDMALGFISDFHGLETAKDIAKSIEYIWNFDMNNDPFAVE